MLSAYDRLLNKANSHSLDIILSLQPVTGASMEEEERPYQNACQYILPVDAPEHERLNAQHASLVAIMGGRPFRAPVTKPMKILDMYVEPRTRLVLSNCPEFPRKESPEKNAQNSPQAAISAS